MNIEIYTKNNCAFCIKAKELLKVKMLHFNEVSIEDNNNKALLLELVPHVKTVPQIFIDGEHIGGYNQLEAYFNNSKNLLTE
jgi:glutaredoxin